LNSRRAPSESQAPRRASSDILTAIKSREADSSCPPYSVTLYCKKTAARKDAAKSRKTGPSDEKPNGDAKQGGMRPLDSPALCQTSSIIVPKAGAGSPNFAAPGGSRVAAVSSRDISARGRPLSGVVCFARPGPRLRRASLEFAARAADETREPCRLVNDSPGTLKKRKRGLVAP